MEFDVFKQLLSATIPKEGINEDNKYQFLSNYYKFSRVVIKEDLTNLDYFMYDAVSYFASVEGTLNKAILFGYIQSTIDQYMKSKHLKVNELLAGEDHTFNMDLEGDLELAKKQVVALIGEYYDELQDMRIDTTTFNSLLKMYSDDLYETNYRQLLQSCAVITVKGLEVFNQGRFEKLHGADDADEYYGRMMSVLRSKYKVQEEEMIDTSGDISQLSRKKQYEEDAYELVADTGIEPIDESFKGFRRTQMLGIEAGAGVGKSRFARWIAYRALTVYNKNVFDITMEQQYTEVWNLYVSTHLFVKHNIYVPDSKINKNEVEEEYQSYVKIAEHDLFSSDNHARLRIVARDMYVEECFQYLTGVYKSEFKYDCLVFDYVSLVDSKAKSSNQRANVNTYDVVTEVYKRLKRDVCRKLKVFTIAINQLSKDGVKALAKGEMTTTYDASNSGETYKSTDFNLVLSSNQSLDKDEKIRITSPKIRSGEKFYNVYAKAKLGCSAFWYEDDADLMNEEEIEDALNAEIA